MWVLWVEGVGKVSGMLRGKSGVFESGGVSRSDRVGCG